ncbi:MAG: vitamin K epoxide reductase family protein [Solirubrobacterales bacterium]|nr:vitamin K epoxide reductase family protein [Solirubrobacterales bacterium]
MLEDQRFIISKDIPIEIGILFIVVAMIAAGFAIWGVRTGGARGERILRATSGVLAGLGLVVAGYIAYKTQIANEPFQCAGGGGGCATVEKSKYANFLGVHMSIWGLIGYTTIMAATIWKGDNARLAAFGLSLFGFAVSLVLRYLELWQIHAACQWCWASAVLMTMLLVVNSCRLIGHYGTGDSDPEPALADEPEPNPAS